MAFVALGRQKAWLEHRLGLFQSRLADWALPAFGDCVSTTTLTPWADQVRISDALVSVLQGDLAALDSVGNSNPDSVFSRVSREIISSAAALLRIISSLCLCNTCTAPVLHFLLMLLRERRCPPVTRRPPLPGSVPALVPPPVSVAVPASVPLPDSSSLQSLPPLKCTKCACSARPCPHSRRGGRR